MWSTPESKAWPGLRPYGNTWNEELGLPAIWHLHLRTKSRPLCQVPQLPRAGVNTTGVTWTGTKAQYWSQECWGLCMARTWQYLHPAIGSTRCLTPLCYWIEWDFVLKHDQKRWWSSWIPLFGSFQESPPYHTPFFWFNRDLIKCMDSRAPVYVSKSSGLFRAIKYLKKWVTDEEDHCMPIKCDFSLHIYLINSGYF